MSEVEETIKRLSTHKGVEGIVIVNNEGIPIRTTLKHDETIQYAALITQLAAKARSVVRDLDPQNDLTFLRIRSKKHEIMVAPGVFLHTVLRFLSRRHEVDNAKFTISVFYVSSDKEYILIVLQNPQKQ